MGRLLKSFLSQSPKKEGHDFRQSGFQQLRDILCKVRFEGCSLTTSPGWHCKSLVGGIWAAHIHAHNRLLVGLLYLEDIFQCLSDLKPNYTSQNSETNAKQKHINWILKEQFLQGFTSSQHHLWSPKSHRSMFLGRFITICILKQTNKTTLNLCICFSNFLILKSLQIHKNCKKIYRKIL